MGSSTINAEITTRDTRGTPMDKAMAARTTTALKILIRTGEAMDKLLTDDRMEPKVETPMAHPLGVGIPTGVPQTKVTGLLKAGTRTDPREIDRHKDRVSDSVLPGGGQVVDVVTGVEVVVVAVEVTDIGGTVTENLLKRTKL